MKLVDLRSDTVTKPCQAMRNAMAGAEVGDDVYGEDPTVRALEEEIAALLGKEAALFVSSGTMGNQLAIACQTRPGDEIIVGAGAHPMFYESGAAAALSGVQFAVAGTGGIFTSEQMLEAAKPQAYYCPRTSLVSIENTHNRGGGRVFPQLEILRIAESAHTQGFAMHLDGARLWNASISSGTSLAALAQPFDSVSICFSKGLGAPVGSALVGSKALRETAKRFRKMWGGGMRQVGILAGAARYAIKHNIANLKEDHRRAAELAALLGPERVRAAPETNIVMIQVGTLAPQTEVAASLSTSAGHSAWDAVQATAMAARGGVLVSAFDRNILRAVLHRDIDDEGVMRAAEVIGRCTPTTR
jgi:threonine aldolase